MLNLVDAGWESILRNAARNVRGEILIVSPFIQFGALQELLPSEDTRARLITRFDLRGFYEGVSSMRALRFILERGGKIRGIRHLHAKLYVFGSELAVVTSANLTKAALNRNHELGVVSSDGGMIDAARTYFDRLWHRAGESLNESTLAEWENQVEAALLGGGRPSMRCRLGDHGTDVGMAIPDTIDPDTQHTGQTFVKFFGTGGNRAPHGRSVIDEVTRCGCHWACTYPTGRRPRRVEDGATMYVARLMEKPKDVIVFGRARALRHVPGRDDATAEDIALRPWKEQWQHYVRVTDAVFVAGTLANGVSLNGLMRSLGANCFASTKRNRLKGSGNVNPRKAYMQQPAVELSSEGAAWMDNMLNAALEQHGRLAGSELEALDWPALAD